MSRSLVVRSASDTYRVPCEQCGHHTEIHHRQLPGPDRKFKVSCDCGNVSRVLFERRREARQPVQIGGYLFTFGTKEPCGDITIAELSVGGMAFTCEKRGFQVRERFTTGFFLNDSSAAWIEQDVKIRTVHETGLVGAEFINPEQYSVELEFYLMNVNLDG